MGKFQGFKIWRINLSPAASFFSLVSVFIFMATNAFAEQAKMSDSLVDSIGVNTHMGETSTVYYTNLPAVINAISSSGIRHIRDSFWYKDGSDHALSLINQVKANTGNTVKFLLVQDFVCTPTVDNVHPEKYLNWGWSLNNISAFEGLNEPQHWCSDWVTATRNGQRLLWNAVKGNPQISMLPVLGPSLYAAGGQSQVTSDAQAIGNLTAYMDYGNTHIYTTDSSPSTANSWIPYPSQNAMDGTKKHWVTETGWPQCNISMTKATKYYSRVFFEYFNFGHIRTYAYELMDNARNTGCEATFGLTYGDGSPKPIFNVIKNTIAVLKDPGSSFTPGSLNYTLSSTNSRLHHTLLQKRDGRYYLVLWHEYSSWENFVAQNITVSFPSVMAQVRKFDPFVSASAITTSSNVSSFSLSVGDQAVIVEITPSSSAPVPSPSPSPSPTPTPTQTQTPSYVITVSSPASGATVSGIIAVKGTAPGMKNLEIFNSAGTLLAQVAPDSEGNFSANVDTTKLANGSQSLRLDAWDAAAGQTFSHTNEKLLNVNVQNGVVTAPSYVITVTSPASGATVSGIIAVKGMAPGMKNLEIFSASGVKLAQVTLDSAGNFSASVDTTKLSNGSQNLRLDAWDASAGQTFSHSNEKLLSINVQNLASTATSYSVTVEAESFATKTTGDGGIPGFWGLWSNGYIENSFNFPAAGTYIIRVTGYSALAGGVGADTEVRIDGVAQGHQILNSTSNTTISFSVTVASAGSHRVAIAFINDAVINGQDRNLILDKVNVAK
jgi:hypothetical protein